ncbi:thiosulfate dehydrogenase [quinone] large subunit [Anoxybacillus tepidamans]|uniref:Thiosulfate dehydrogenase [quinone] large subunit n=1 Tax=Anoxybacteroides tepidamans TaxID=265948 RepID=A0A7W8MTD0_9BACL|nr:DoxX family protein [Anoxybacillus tepidamans]MBB5323322.1 thiosulfate dehydrogenase [quinone] large subunit [Anoxybacillus tepidamans]
MVVKWLREHVSAAAVLTLFRLYLGYEWLTAGWRKLTGGFDATGFLKGALSQASGEHPAVQRWWASFIENVALPNVGFFNFLVPWGETLVGIALLLGIFTTFAALMGAVMNFAFMFSGTTSTNPQMVLLTFFIVVAGANAGKFGLDHWVIPCVRKYLKKRQRRHIASVS